VTVPAAHCPHCLNVLADTLPWPPVGQRCPQCRLVVGPGRALGDEAASRRQTATGSAAGFASNAARRDDAEPVDEDLVLDAVLALAAQRNLPVNQLRMLDYDATAREDPGLPTLAEVLATCGTWKRARALAEQRLAPEAGADEAAG
jgi:hypothetical protein